MRRSPGIERALWKAALVISTSAATMTSPLRAATLTWDAPSACPGREAILWRVEEALGTKLDAAAALDFKAKVRQSAATRWVVTLEVSPVSTQRPAADDATDAEGATLRVQKRTLEAASCDELAQAISVAIALALGADIAGSTAQDETASPAASAVASAEHAKPPPVANRAARDAMTKKQEATDHRYWFAGELGAVLDRGTLPSWAPGISGAVLLGANAFSLRVGGLFLPRETSVVAGDAGGTFALFAATAAACGATERGAVQLRLCLGVEVGRMTGEGVNVANRQLGASTWFAPAGDLELSIPLGDPLLRLFGRGGVAAPLIRKQFSVVGVGPVHQPDAIAGRLGLGLELLWR